MDVAVGAYDGAEICQIVGLLLLNNLANKFDKNSVGLYREEELAFVDKMSKEFHRLFKENALSLEIEFNLKTINYMALTNHIANLIIKNFTSTPNSIILQIFLNNYLINRK